MARTRSMVAPNAKYVPSQVIDIGGGGVSAGGNVNYTLRGNLFTLVLAAGRTEAQHADDLRIDINTRAGFSAALDPIDNTKVLVTADDGGEFTMHLWSDEATHTHTLTNLVANTALLYAAALAGAAEPVTNEDGVEDRNNAEYVTVTFLAMNATATAKVVTGELWGRRPNGVWEPHDGVGQVTMTFGAAIGLLQKSRTIVNRGYTRFAVKGVAVPAASFLSSWIYESDQFSQVMK